MRAVARQSTRELLLASASPRRCELLTQIGVSFRVVAHGVDEIREPGEPPREYVMRLARAKAHGALDSVSADRKVLVLAADTIVVLGDQVLEKPAGRKDALTMLAALSGRTHEVYTAVAVTDGARMEQRLSETKVSFRELSPAEIRRYWATGEPVDKAGAYAIQGFAAVFVSALSGSYSGVVGLPLCETAALLEGFGMHCWQSGTRQEQGQQ